MISISCSEPAARTPQHNYVPFTFM